MQRNLRMKEKKRNVQNKRPKFLTINKPGRIQDENAQKGHLSSSFGYFKLTV